MSNEQRYKCFNVTESGMHYSISKEDDWYYISTNKLPKGHMMKIDEIVRQLNMINEYFEDDMYLDTLKFIFDAIERRNMSVSSITALIYKKLFKPAFKEMAKDLAKQHGFGKTENCEAMYAVNILIVMTMPIFHRYMLTADDKRKFQNDITIRAYERFDIDIISKVASAAIKKNIMEYSVNADESYEYGMASIMYNNAFKFSMSIGNEISFFVVLIDKTLSQMYNTIEYAFPESYDVCHAIKVAKRQRYLSSIFKISGYVVELNGAPVIIEGKVYEADQLIELPDGVLLRNTNTNEMHVISLTGDFNIKFTKEGYEVFLTE